MNGKAAAERSVISMGMFDGVHIGHKVLLERAAVLARRENCPLIVCTFQQHPMAFLCPEKAPRLLTTLAERQQAIQNLGADMFFAMPFDSDLAQMAPECYVGQLVRRFHPVAVVCGYNHHYGKDGKGSPALLEVLGGALGFATSIVPQITLGGKAVSSSDIRQCLSDGDVIAASRMLGRPYARQAELAENDRLVLLRDDKQPVKDGKYRGRICLDGKRIPVVFRQKGDECFCPAAASFREIGKAEVEYICPQG